VNVPSPADAALFDQARRLKVPGPHGGYRAPVIGHWDHLGYTHCLACPPEPVEPPARIDPIDADNCAAEGERCDFCQMVLLTAALAKFTSSRDGEPQ
jgi:hypothetical protein